MVSNFVLYVGKRKFQIPARIIWHQISNRKGAAQFHNLLYKGAFALTGEQMLLWVKPRENEGTEREAPGPALGICHVHESYF